MLRSLALNDAFWSAILTHIRPCFPQLMVDGNPKPFEPSSICSWEHVWTSRSCPEWFHNFRYGAWHFCAPMDLTKTPLLSINVEQMIGPIPLYVFREAGISKNIIPYHHPYFFSTISWSHIVPPCLVIKWLLNSPAMFHGDFLDLDLCSRCLVVDDHKVAVQLQTIVFTGSRGTKCCTAQPW